MLLKIVLQSAGFAPIPPELIERSSLYNWQLIFGIFICLVFVAISRMNNTRVIIQLVNVNIKLNGLKSQYREHLSLSKLPSLLLLLNFLLASSILLFLSIEKQLFSSLPLQLILASPIVLFIWDNIGFGLSILLTGEKKFFIEPSMIRLFGAQLLGIIIWIALTVHLLYPAIRLTVELVLSYIILIEFLLRVLRSILVVYRLNASWYYIILYFCTLEILPLFIAFSMIVGFSG